MASISSRVGGRWVTTLCSSSSRFAESESCTRSPPTTERTSRLRSGGGLSILINRRFFFFESRERASELNSGPMITSLKISEIALARARVIGRLQTMIPPKGCSLICREGFVPRFPEIGVGADPARVRVLEDRRCGLRELRDELGSRADVEDVVV